MARFRFQLEAVLEHRIRLEQEQQRVVADLEAKRVALEQTIRSCQESLVRERAEMRSLLASADIRGARFQAGAAARFVTNAQRAVLELAGIHKRLETARAVLLEASKKRKAVELLKERRYEEWRYRRNQRENAEIDELAVMRAGRGSEIA
jgi:flagellar FliJ protein